MSVAALVIAAGASSRMGRPKALLPISEQNFAERIAATARAAGVQSVVFVLGPPDGDVIRAALREQGFGIAWNPAPARGMLSSIQIGIAAISPSVDAALIWPVDLPLVQANTVRSVVAAAFDAAMQHERSALVIPSHEGRGGHPVLVGRDYFAEVAALPVEAGLRALMRAHAGSAVRLPVEDAFVREDIDTPDDYARLVGGAAFLQR